MSSKVIRTVEFEKPRPNGKVARCTLEEFEDGSIYIAGEQLGELIVEFAEDAYEKALSQLAGLGYHESKTTGNAKQQAG
jgi:hypothetical protein